MRFAGFAALGAVLGSFARYAVGLAIPHASGIWPWATFAVNVFGALIIGLLSVTPRVMSSERNRAFLVTGVLGGFTTYSAFAVESLQFDSAQRALLYIVGTFAAGILAVDVGHRLGSR